MSNKRIREMILKALNEEFKENPLGWKDCLDLEYDLVMDEDNRYHSNFEYLVQKKYIEKDEAVYYTNSNPQGSSMVRITSDGIDYYENSTKRYLVMIWEQLVAPDHMAKIIYAFIGAVITWLIGNFSSMLSW